MILLIECIVGCLIFGAAVVGSVLINKTLWLHEYAPAVQEEFLRLHPEYQETKQKTDGVGLVAAKIITCLVFVVILSYMVYIAGARDFTSAFCKCYIIWSAVNWFDVFVLDLGILAHWKKVRLPGTEHRDKEYQSNNRKSIMEGFFGAGLGLVVSVIVGSVITLLC